MQTLSLSLLSALSLCIRSRIGGLHFHGPYVGNTDPRLYVDCTSARRECNRAAPGGRCSRPSASGATFEVEKGDKWWRILRNGLHIDTRRTKREALASVAALGHAAPPCATA